MRGMWFTPAELKRGHQVAATVLGHPLEELESSPKSMEAFRRNAQRNCYLYCRHFGLNRSSCRGRGMDNRSINWLFGRSPS
jgi:hypothetical protein